MDAGKFPAGMRVLAVDDDRVSLKILEQQLKHCNYIVTAVTHAKEALDMLRERKVGDQFELVISDVVMPDMDGFKLLELIGLEMDIPVIMLSANDETETVMKGINHGACDYLVKPVRLEQLRGVWTHVLRNSKTDPRNSISGGNDDADQKIQSGDGDKGERDGAKQNRRNSKKKKNGVDAADEGKENKSTQKRPRVQWPGNLHREFIEAVNQIGMDRAVPKKILEVMNVDGLTRENVASHLQKYRIYLKKLSEGKVKNSYPFADGPKAWRCDWVPANSNTNVVGSSNHHPELGRYQSASYFVGSPSSSNVFSRMNSPSAYGAYTFLPTQSVQPMSSQRNFGIPRQETEPVNNRVNVNLSDASQCFPNISNGAVFNTSKLSRPSVSSFTNISNGGAEFNTSKPLSLGISGSSFANTSSDIPTLSSTMHFPSPRSCSSYASILRDKILGASRGIPFEEMAEGEMLAPSSHLPSQSPEFTNQPSVQIQSPSAGLFNQVAWETDAGQFAGPINCSNSWKAAALSRFPDLTHNVGMSNGPSQGNIIKMNQLSRLAASSGQIPNFGNGYRNQVAGIVGKTAPGLSFSEQVAPFYFGSNTHYTAMPIGNSNLGSSSSTRPALPNLQIENSFTTEMLNGEVTSGNLSEGGSINQQAVGDQVINSNEFLMGTCEVQNGASGDLDDFLTDLVNEDFVNNGDAFSGGDWDFAP